MARPKKYKLHCFPLDIDSLMTPISHTDDNVIVLQELMENILNLDNPSSDDLARQLNKLADQSPDSYYILMREAKTVFEKQEILRKYYLENELQITDLAERNLRKSFNINAFEWYRLFTPIEMYAWEFIRISGVILYPQYPALNYMLDFWEPLFKDCFGT
ncbi:MAG: hypothetical protein ABI863_09845 [Ginsengibacter sp.]